MNVVMDERGNEREQKKSIQYQLFHGVSVWILMRNAEIKQILRLMTMMEISSLHLGQPTGILRSTDQVTFSARPMECAGKSSEFHFLAPHHHLHRCPAVFASRRQTNRNLRLPSWVNRMDAAPFCASNGSVPLRQF
jgi:hypothetical protein